MAQKAKTDKVDKYFITPQGHVRDRILIHDSPDIPREGIFVSLNTYPFLIKPGQEIDIPRAVRLMLDTRIRTDVTQGEDGKEHVRDMPRFTYTLIKEGVNLAPPAESETEKESSAVTETQSG